MNRWMIAMWVVFSVFYEFEIANCFGWIWEVVYVCNFLVLWIVHQAQLSMKSMQDLGFFPQKMNLFFEMVNSREAVRNWKKHKIRRICYSFEKDWTNKNHLVSPEPPYFIIWKSWLFDWHQEHLFLDENRDVLLMKILGIWRDRRKCWIKPKKSWRIIWTKRIHWKQSSSRVQNVTFVSCEWLSIFKPSGWSMI